MTEGKREQPFGLDMNFAEALQRFSRTDPAELPQSKHSKQPRKRRMSRDGEPFVFTLLDAEIKQITETEAVGSGGLQSLQRRLKDQLEQGPTVTFDNAELGQLIRYMTRFGPGTFQTRLRKAFSRSLYELLAFEGKF